MVIHLQLSRRLGRKVYCRYVVLLIWNVSPTEVAIRYLANVGEIHTDGVISVTLLFQYEVPTIDGLANGDIVGVFAVTKILRYEVFATWRVSPIVKGLRDDMLNSV